MQQKKKKTEATFRITNKKVGDEELPNELYVPTKQKKQFSKCVH